MLGNARLRVLARVLLLLALLLSAVTDGRVLAQGKLSIDDAFLSWREGDIAEDDLNGNARDVLLSVGRKWTATADRMVVRSRKEGDQVFLERLLLVNVDVAHPSRRISASIGNLDIRDVLFRGETVYDLLDNLFDTDADDDVLVAVREWGVKDVFVNYWGGGLEFAISNIRVDNEWPDGFTMVGYLSQRGEFSVEGFDLRIDETIAEPFFRSLDEFLRTVGRDSLAIDLNGTYSGFGSGDGRTIEFEYNMNIRDLGRIGFNVDLGLLDSAVEGFEAFDQDAPVDQGKAVNLLLSGSVLRHAELRLQNTGLLSALGSHFQMSLGLPRHEQAEVFTRLLGEDLEPLAPRAWAMASTPIRGFLRTGGALFATLQPTDPVPVSLVLGGFGSPPDEILSSLGFVVDHER